LCLEGLEERQVMSTLFLGGHALGHFNSFADAYRAAHAGDVIQIEPGAVVSDPSGTIKLDKPITLQGDPLFGPAPVLSSIELQGSGFFRDPVVLTNLNLGNKDVTQDFLGDCLTIQNSILKDVHVQEKVTILNSVLNDVISDADAIDVKIQKSTLRSIHDCSFLGRLVITRSTITGAVQADGVNEVTLTNNTFHVDGSAGHRAIDVDGCPNTTITDNVIHFNQGDADAKALRISNMSGSIFHNTFDTQFVGTGLEVVGCVQVSIEANDFNANAVGIHVGPSTSWPPQPCTSSVIDLGGGSLGSAGDNDFTSYSATDGRYAIVVDNVSTCTISALHNFWAPRPGWTSVDPRSVIQANGCTIDVDIPTPLPSQPGTHPVVGHIIAARPLVPRPLP
jgi:hypothetical protein